MNKSDSLLDFFGDQLDDDLFSLPMALLEETPALQENMLLNSDYWYQDNDINTVLTAYLFANNWLSPQKRFMLAEQTFDIVAITPAVNTSGSTHILNPKNERVDVFDEIMPTFMTDESAQARIFCPMSLSQRHWVLYEIVLMRDQLKYEITVTAHDPYGYGEVGKNEFSLLRNALTQRIANFYNGIQPEITITEKKSTFPPRQHPSDKSSCGVIIISDILLRIEGKQLGGDGPYPVGALSLRTAQYQHTVNQIFANSEEEIEGFKKRVFAAPFAAPIKPAAVPMKPAAVPMKPAAVPKKPAKEKSKSSTTKKRDPKKPPQDKRSTKKTKEDPPTQPQITNQEDLFTSHILKPFVMDGFTGNLQLGYWTKDNHYIYFVDTDTQEALQKNTMDMQALFKKICDIMYKQNQRGASHLKIIFFSSIDTPFQERSEAYSGTLLDYQLNLEKGQYEPSRFILIDPFHNKKFPNKPKLDSVPKFLLTIFQANPSQVTILDKIGSRATKYAFRMALYVIIRYAFKNELLTEFSEESKNKLVTSFPWPTLSKTIGNSKLLQIKDNHVPPQPAGFFNGMNQAAISDTNVPNINTNTNGK